VSSHASQCTYQVSTQCNAGSGPERVGVQRAGWQAGWRGRGGCCRVGVTFPRSKHPTGSASRTQEGARFRHCRCISPTRQPRQPSAGQSSQVTGAVISAMAEYMTTSFVQLGAGYDAANKADAVVKELLPTRSSSALHCSSVSDARARIATHARTLARTPSSHALIFDLTRSAAHDFSLTFVNGHGLGEPRPPPRMLSCCNAWHCAATCNL
jgi:hypothetical protein